MKQYEKIVYISHPSGGLPENTEIIGKIINRLIKEFPNFLFISPVHCFSYAYDAVNYITGIEMCLWLLDQCTEMWVFGDYEKSKGCNMEIGFCLARDIPFTINPFISLEFERFYNNLLNPVQAPKATTAIRRV